MSLLIELSYNDNVSEEGGGGESIDGALLMETGDFLLLETGEYILVE